MLGQSPFENFHDVEMFRSPPITIGACFAIISGLILMAGMRELSRYEKMSATPVNLPIDEFVYSRPDDTNRFTLTNFRPGASVYPDPVRKDGQWEKVYVCLFSNRTRRLPKNYISVIVEIDGISGRRELAKLLSNGELDIYYWPNEQDLPSSVYNRMAFKYKGMQFSSCLFCKSGGPEPSPNYGNNCVMVGFLGFILSFVGVVGYYAINLLLSFFNRERDPWYDEDDAENEVKNKAGLPTLQTAIPVQASVETEAG